VELANVKLGVPKIRVCLTISLTINKMQIGIILKETRLFNVQQRIHVEPESRCVLRMNHADRYTSMHYVLP